MKSQTRDVYFRIKVNIKFSKIVTFEVIEFTGVNFYVFVLWNGK